MKSFLFIGRYIFNIPYTFIFAQSHLFVHRFFISDDIHPEILPSSALHPRVL